MTEKLPPDILRVMRILAVRAAGYGNRLQPTEVARLKADLMNNRRHWSRFSADAVHAECMALGMTAEYSTTIRGLVSRAQQDLRLKPEAAHRNFEFEHDRPYELRPVGQWRAFPLRTSQEW